VTIVLPVIAVVDDEAPVRTMLQRVLRLGDYQVMTFESGEAFLSSLDQQLPACAVVDIHMPNLSGFDVQMRLQALSRDVPVVFITASDDPALDALVHDAHGVALLRKPFRSDELLATVDAALARRKRDD